MAARPDLEVVVARLDAGERVKVIAADLGVTPRTIRDWLHAAGLPLASTRSRERRRSLLADPSWLHRQYVDEGLSVWAIGKELEIPTAEVRATLERFGIERPPVNSHLTADALRTAFAGGETVTSIARIAAVDRATVRTALRRYGIENPRADGNRRPAKLDDAEWVSARYIGARMSIHAIADELGTADNTVARALKRHRIPRRHGNRSGELLEFLGVDVGHGIDDDVGVWQGDRVGWALTRNLETLQVDPLSSDLESCRGWLSMGASGETDGRDFGMRKRLAIGVAVAFMAGGGVVAGAASAAPPETPPGQTVWNWGQCKNGGATPNPQDDPGGLGPSTIRPDGEYVGPLFTTKTPFEGAQACPKG